MKGFSAFNRLLFILNIFPAALLGLSCYIAYYPLSELPLFDVFGLLVPTLVVANMLFLFFWLLQRKWYAILSFVVLVLGFLSFGSVYQFNKSIISDSVREISILSYNVQDFGYYRGNEVFKQLSNGVTDFLNNQKPDVICFQEFSRIMARQLKAYPYRFQTPYFSGKTTQAIFSKYPIINGGSLDFPNSGNNALFADIIYGKDTLRIYNIHLESFKIHSFRSLLSRNFGIDFLKRLQYTASKHREQADLLMVHRSKSPYPAVFCGDFNQTPYSPTFQKLQSGMRDTFKEKGNGWGTTFVRNIISARVDFILTDAERFEVLEHRNYDLKLSDHLPVMARIRLRSDE